MRLTKVFYYLTITYGLVHFFIKMSILCLYRRIFTNINRAFTIGLRGTMVYVTLWSLATAVLCIFQCTPISYFWLEILPGAAEDPTRTCINRIPAEVSLNILNTIGDVALLVLPALALWDLQMSRGRKIAVAMIFLIGIL